MGAQLQMLMLAPTSDGSIGIDLDSGAFVRALHAPAHRPPSTLDVVVGELAGTVDPPDDARPEAVEMTAAPRRVGRLGRRRASRYLDALGHPPKGPLLGFSGPSVPFWTLAGDRPSLTVLTAEVGPQLRWTEAGFQCRFAWQGLVHELPLADSRLIDRMQQARASSCSGRELDRILGYRANRLLVVLSTPIDGYCHKQVAAALPGR